MPECIPDDARRIRTMATDRETEAIIRVDSRASEPVGCAEAPPRALPSLTPDRAAALPTPLPDELCRWGGHQVVAVHDGMSRPIGVEADGSTVHYPEGMDTTAAQNPFVHLQRNAELSPSGLFARVGDQRISNREAAVSAQKIAYELRRLGVRPGQIVALEMPEVLRVVFTEAVYHEAAISTVLPTGWEPRGDVRVDWLLSTLPDAADRGATVVAVDDRFLRRIEENPYGIRPRPDPLEVLRIVFSSGTTGRPRAVALGRAMEAAMDAALPTWFDGGPTLMLLDTGTAWGIGEFYLSVKGGRPFLSAAGVAPDAALRLIVEERVRRLRGSPAQIEAIVAEAERTGGGLEAIETVEVAGTIMPTPLRARVRAAAPGARIRVSYGSTEAGTGAARTTGSDDPFDVGHAPPGTTLEVVDDAGRPAPPGVEGTIRYRSYGMVDRYLGDPDATAAAFRDGWFYPGDRGVVRSDGGLTLTGRQSEILNAGGVKVDPNRVDELARSFDGIDDACAFAFTTPAGFDGIGLAVVTAVELDAAGLGAHLADHLGSAAPQLIARVGSIPRTPSGKPSRRELSARFAGA